MRCLCARVGRQRLGAPLSAPLLRVTRARSSARKSLPTRRDRFGVPRRVRADGGLPPRPTIEQVRAMPRFIYEYSNEMLFFAARDPLAHDVHQERLIREIMCVDDVDYDTAAETMRAIFRTNIDQSRFLMMPFHLGLGVTARCVLAPSLPSSTSLRARARAMV